MKRSSTLRMALATALMAASVGAQALYVDFTSDAWQNAIEPDNTKTTATVGGVTLTAIPSTQKLTFNSGIAQQLGCLFASVGLACDGDGVGITDDEIGSTGVEQLQVDFGGLSVDILGVEVLDLFTNEGPNGQAESGLIMQAGNYSFTATSSGISGYKNTGFTALNIKSLILTTPNDGFSDYSLARITYNVRASATAVPEPGTLSLLGIGLLGLALIRRRAKA